MGLAAGALLALSLPPWGWWPLAVVGVAVVVSSCADAPFSRRLLAATGFGLGFHVIGMWWITGFSVPGFVATAIVETAILALPLLAVPTSGSGRLVAVPAALVVAQAVQGHWPFGGVPVNGIALGQVDGPLAPAARLGGHLLLVALVGAAGAGLALLVERWAGRRPAAGRGSLVGGPAAVVVVAVVALLGAVAPRGSAAGALRVAAVQGGGQRGLLAINAVSAEVFGAHLQASEPVRPPVDLVVWPENVIDVDSLDTASSADRAMADLARRLDATVVAGVIEDAPGDRFRNAAVAWAPDGHRVDRYEKVRRVPFGEYIPARGLFSRLADTSAVPNDAIPGRGPGMLTTPAGTLGVLISYEVFFADRARAAVKGGGAVLLVPTNASSFTTSQVPGQELAAARLRAIETGRVVVQAAPTGYSAVVDATGRVRARSDLGPPTVLERTISLRRGQTVATRLGDGPLTVLAVGVLAGFAALCWWRRKES